MIREERRSVFLHISGFLFYIQDSSAAVGCLAAQHPYCQDWVPHERSPTATASPIEVALAAQFCAWGSFASFEFDSKNIPQKLRSHFSVLGTLARVTRNLLILGISIRFHLPSLGLYSCPIYLCRILQMRTRGPALHFLCCSLFTTVFSVEISPFIH